MEPTRAQKNGSLINSLKKDRQTLQELITKVSSSYNSYEANLILDKLREADHWLLETLQNYGMVLKLEEGDE